jgi:Ca2+/Na+ antiporter
MHIFVWCIIMDLAHLATPVAAFYLLTFCNFTREIIGCRLQHVMNNIIMKHIIGCFLMFALIVLASPDNADINLLSNAGLAIGVYAWFFMTTRTPLPITALVLILLFVVYILNTTKSRASKENDTSRVDYIAQTQKILTWIALALSIIGFAIYFVEKQNEYGRKFQWRRFLVGSNMCRNYTPAKARLI